MQHRVALMVTVPILLAGCQSCPVDVDEAAPAVLSLEPFTETIPESAVSFEMLAVQAGTVKLPDGTSVEVGPFWMGKTEVTWELYDAYMLEPVDELDVDAISKPSKPYAPPDRGYGHNGYAAISMSHQGAETFCKWLSEQTGRKYRLPTEAEWMYAAAAGDASWIPTDEKALEEVAWLKWNSNRTPHPVGSKPANPWGFHDMLGNVAEFCAREGESTPFAKGGSFRNRVDMISITTRDEQTDEWSASDPQIPKSPWWLTDCTWVGFRLVCDP